MDARGGKHGTDSATFPALSAVAPVQHDDSHAAGMQHMAVIRDFVIPAN